LVQPAARVGELARAAGIPFLLDACQSAGQIHLDVNALGCDMLSATGRKYLRGPRGTGFLYIRKALLPQVDPPSLDLHAATWTAQGSYEVRSDAKKFETWESAAATRLGLGVAIEYALALGLKKIEGRVRHLAALLREQLAEIKGITVRDQGRVRCGIVTFTCSDHSPGVVMERLKAKGIAVRTVERASARIDMEQRGLEELVRASVHYYNTEAEIEQLCAALRAISTEV
jgi:selenocysteine lyase/cysteine desulfurase